MKLHAEVLQFLHHKQENTEGYFAQKKAVILPIKCDVFR